MHEPAVWHAIETRRCIDAGNPQAPEIALAIPPVPMAIKERLEHSLIATPPEAMLTAVLALGDLENLFVSSPGPGTPFYSGHFSTPPTLTF
jgi:hypothetical protein